LPFYILNVELFSTAAYELEPGEIPPFPVPYCQTDELELGEIRQYAVSKNVCVGLIVFKSSDNLGLLPP